MHRALQLAKNGLGSVSPNPMVGCVITHNDSIIGEGWHQQFGEAHAEVNAINSVKNKKILKEATVYVTLEPCSFVGKTPACSDLLIHSKVKKVVVATLDPNSKVAGSGIAALKNEGIIVEQGVLKKEATELNKRFFINQQLNRPYIILKWAQTKDGFIARKNFDSKWISSEQSRQLVHKWRAQEDAILVGKNTAIHDNPSLTVRDWHGTNPVRVLLDRNLNVKAGLNLFGEEANTLVYNVIKNDQQKKVEQIKIEKENFINKVLANLYQREIGSILIEGGSQILNKFIKLGLWDEMRIFTSNQLFKEGVNAPKINYSKAYSENIENDTLSYYFNPLTSQHWQKN